MKSGKRVWGVIIVSLLLISSVSFVSAGWKDWFGFGNKNKNLTGELNENFDIGITMTNQAPFIYNWTVSAGTPGTCVNDVIDYPGNNFRIAIYDPDGYSDLADANVYVNFTKAGQVRPATYATCTPQMNSGPNIEFFICSITMNYYDAPGTGAASGWVVNVYADDGVLAATNNHKSSTTGNSSYPYFDYNSYLQIPYGEAPIQGTQDQTIDWTGLQTTDWLKPADNHLNFTNCGNTNLAYLNISAVNLTGFSYGDILDADSFAAVAYDSVPCANTTRTNLSSITSPAIKGGAIASGPAAYRSVYFCINDINKRRDPALITVDTYRTSAPTPNPWVLTFYQ